MNNTVDTENKKIKEPLVRIVKRSDLTKTRKAFIITMLIIALFFVSMLFLFAISGRNPFVSLQLIIEGTFKNGKIKDSTMKEIILLFGVALALIPAYKMKFWNVGGQGQILMGGLFTAMFMIVGERTNMPSVLVLILSLVCAIIAGGLWALIPALFKAKWNTNETLFTLMMNYVAIQIVKFATDNWKGDKASLGIINSISKRGYLPELGNNLVLPFIIVIIICFSLFIYLNKTKQGYQVKVVGESHNTARYAGINVGFTIIKTVTLSGMICGLVGFFYVAGFDHTLDAVTTGGSYGFTAIIACWLANMNPFVCFLYSFLIVFLNKGSKNLSNKNWTNLNEYSCEFIFLAVILTIMIIKFFMNYKLTGKHIDKVNAKIEVFCKKTEEKVFTPIGNFIVKIARWIKVNIIDKIVLFFNKLWNKIFTKKNTHKEKEEA